MGYETVAVARGKDKEPLARRLGAHHYVDSEAEDPAKQGVRPMNKIYALERAAEGYDRMISGNARFRVVLETGS